MILHSDDCAYKFVLGTIHGEKIRDANHLNKVARWLMDNEIGAKHDEWICFLSYGKWFDGRTAYGNVQFVNKDAAAKFKLFWNDDLLSYYV